MQQFKDKERVVLPGLTFGGRPVFAFYWRNSVEQRAKYKPDGLAYRLSGNGKVCRVIKCATTSCGNCINWEALVKYNFPEFRRFCDRCRTYNGIVLSSPQLWRDRDYVVEQRISGKKQNYIMRCKQEGCARTLWRPAWYTNKGFCNEHKKSARYLFGVFISSDAIWRRKKEIVDIKYDRNGRRVYLHRCRNTFCGHVKTSVLSNFLRRSEGCRVCVGKNRRSSVNQLALRALKRRAKKHRISCSLTQKQFDVLASVPTCFYCNKKVKRETWAKLSELHKSPPYFIDRIDNRAGYSWANSAVCCKSCNRVKNAWHSASHIMALQTFVGWESELLLLVRKMKPDRVRRLAAKHRRSGG